MIDTPIAHYKVTAKLGQGGMGEVYRATDTKLDREVAIKVLPESFAQDKERLARFEREAKVLASFDHPNIGAILGVEDADGKRCLILQLIEGETLTERLRIGAMPIDEALDVCKQIAEALEAAHEKGIIHRDLKPGNVKITPDGKVKVLDFGLAKAAIVESSVAPSDNSQSPTLTADYTRPGVILGTAAYMSPEQARAKPVDKRSDIWSFGCVLYECLTGNRLFGGISATDSIGAVIHKEPDWTILPENTPATIQLLLRKCLAKDRKRRLQHIDDARVDLEQAIADPNWGVDSGYQSSASSTKGISKGVLAVAVAVTGLIAVALGWFLKPASPVTEPVTPPVTRLLLSVEENSRLSGGNLMENNSWAFQRPSRTAMALSPMGRYLVYTATTDNTNSHLYLRPMDQDHARRMQGTEGASHPVFSPDGKSIGFVTGRIVKRVEIEGGEPQTIVSGISDQPIPISINGINWCDDGTILLGLNLGPLMRVSATGGTPERLTELDRKKGEISHRLPHMLPGSKAVMFTIMKGFDWDETEIVVQSLETNERTLLIEDGTDPRYVPTGHLLFVRKGSLMAVGFDPERLETLGQPVRVIEDVMQAIYAGNDGLDTGAAQVTFSSSGTLALATGGVYSDLKRSLIRVDRNGESQPFGLPPHGYMFPRLSPDGTQLAYTVGRGQSSDIWIYDIERDVPRRLTTDGNKNVHPEWSPDGKWIAFDSDRNGSFKNLYRMAADGTGNPERLTVSDGLQEVGSWSSEGVVAFLEISEKTPNWDIWVLPPEGEAHPFFESPFKEQYPAFSPDGKWLAYVSDQSGTFEVYVRPYPGPDPPTKITSGGFLRPVWSRDGKQLYYRKGRSKMLVVDVTPGQPFKAGTPEVLFEKGYGATIPIRSYDVDDEGHFVMVTQAEERPQPVTQIHVVLNWFTDLNKLVPVDQN